MNGRLYDPALARVLSPDNYVQDPFSSQHYNRYSYAHNNPLVYNDPDGQWVNFAIGAAVGGVSGYMIGRSQGKRGWSLVGYTLAGAGIGAATAGIGQAVVGSFGVTVGPWSTVGAYAAGGAASGAVSGGSFAALAGGSWKDVGRGALLGGAIGGATGALGGYLEAMRLENYIFDASRYLAGGEDYAKMFPGVAGIWLDDATVVYRPQFYLPPAPKVIYATPGPIMDLVSGVGAAAGAAKALTHLHHSFPKFLGGAPK
jgi:hypothetical protein